VTVSGESALWVDTAEIPSDSDIGKLGRALAAGRHGERDELMASTAGWLTQAVVCPVPPRRHGGTA
jgi:hypothetical protein